MGRSEVKKESEKEKKKEGITQRRRGRREETEEKERKEQDAGFADCDPSRLREHLRCVTLHGCKSWRDGVQRAAPLQRREGQAAPLQARARRGGIWR